MKTKCACPKCHGHRREVARGEALAKTDCQGRGLAIGDQVEFLGRDGLIKGGVVVGVNEKRAVVTHVECGAYTTTRCHYAWLLRVAAGSRPGRVQK
jgi:hypothetical protein